MAFNEYRNLGKKLEIQELDIERFAYDVFAYTLPMCGFPKAKVPTTTRKENCYVKEDFIMNVGLSVLPIALYMRDDWKTTFEISLEAVELNNILKIEYFLEKTLINCSDYEDEDTLSKIQFSLALCNEMILFFNYKGIETYFNILPKLCSHLCSKLIAESDDIDEPLSSALIMHPDVTESWIKNFIRNVAIPYGSSEGVSDRFCVYSLEKESFGDFIENVTEESVSQRSDVSNERSEQSLPEDSNSGSYFVPRTWNYQSCAGKFEGSEKRTILHGTSNRKNTNGLTYVLHHCLKGRKRSRSQKLDIGEFEDALKGISLEKENISPEKQNTKRQRKISDNDELNIFIHGQASFLVDKNDKL